MVFTVIHIIFSTADCDDVRVISLSREPQVHFELLLYFSDPATFLANDTRMNAMVYTDLQVNLIFL